LWISDNWRIIRPLNNYNIVGPGQGTIRSDTLEPKHLDIYLLRCLTALISEAHVTRAAARMGMTQPAMSATLARLRGLLGDPLLVRTEKGMVPTARALELAASVRKGLALIDQALTREAPFDCANATMRFDVAATESVAFVLIPALITHLRRVAPGISLRVHVPELARAVHELEEGYADLLISFMRAVPEGLHTSLLLRQRLAVIAARLHPEVRDSISLDQYIRWPHAYYTRGRDSGATLETTVDETLAGIGQSRRVGVWLPSILSSSAVVAASDMLATVPEYVARHFEATLGLQVIEPPVPMPDVDIAMYWHDRMHKNSAHQWLRATLREVAGHLQLAGQGHSQPP
jgi:DNA-binding transcriptional LysR family regulator